MIHKLLFCCFTFLALGVGRCKHSEAFVSESRLLKQGQQNSNWCYAAATKDLFLYYGISQEQFQIVDSLNPGNSCGKFISCYNEDVEKDFSKCNVAFDNDVQWLEFINHTLSKINQHILFQRENFDINQIKTALTDTLGPVIANLGLNGGQTHAVLLTGFFQFGDNVDNPIFFKVINPGNKCAESCEYLMLYHEGKFVQLADQKSMQTVNPDGYIANYSNYFKVESAFCFIPKKKQNE